MDSRFDRTFGRTIAALLACAGLLLVPFNLQATPLLPGGTVVPDATISPNTAALIVDSGAQPFASVDGTSFTGTLRTRVYANDPGNPFPFGLTFTFLLTNNGPDTLERLVTIGYTGYVVDVGVNANPPFGVVGAVPVSVDRSGNGRVVGWDYTGGPGIVPGGNSALLVMHTNVSQYMAVQNSVINGSVATVTSFGPAIIPEPSTLGLAGVAMLGVIARRRPLRRSG